MTVPSGNRKPAVLQAAGRAYRAVPGGMLKPTNAEYGRFTQAIKLAGLTLQ